MPELPEVETVRRGLEKALENKTITRIHVRRRDLRKPIPDSFENSLQGAKIKSLARRGKYILIHTDQKDLAVLHLGMSGRIRIEAPANNQETQKHDHVILHIDQGTRIIFHDPRRFGMFYNTPAKEWENLSPFTQMGPEPLDEEWWTAKKLHQSLQTKTTPIKCTLLDQRIVAGLGNIYVCEALHRAHISPLRASNTLSSQECDILTCSVRETLKDAIKAGGSTLKDYSQTDGKLGYFQYSFKVYDKTDSPCSSCGKDSTIMRIVQGGRSTFYCPHCQK